MGNIPTWGWYVLPAIPLVSMAAALVLVFVSPTAAGIISAVGVLFVTPLAAVGLWLWGDDEAGSEHSSG